MGEKQVFNIFKWMATYDRRFLYVCLILTMVIPLLYPVVLPVPVTAVTQQYYNVINSVKPGDKVLFVYNTEPSGYNELQSGILATLRILFTNEAHVAIIVAVPETVTIVEQSLADVKDVMDKYNYKYGQNYVYLGYKFPNEASVVAAAQDFQSAIRDDYYGNSLKGTFLENVNNYADWALICDFASAHQQAALRDHFALRGTPLVQNCIGVMVSMNRSYLDTGLYKAMLYSMRGGAELEYLINAPGPGLTAMNAFSISHYLVIVFIIIGNIGFFMYTKNKSRGD